MSGFSRREIEDNENLKMVDENQEYNLNLFCYLNCDETKEEIVKRCRGLIYDGDKLVLQAFPYTQNVRDNDIE